MNNEREQTAAAKFIHLVCGICHLVSASAILIVGLQNNPLSAYEYDVSRNFASQGSVWRFQCYNNGTYVKGYTACDDSDRQFGIYTDNAMRKWYNLLLAAIAFAYISGFVHIARWYHLNDIEYDHTDEQLYRLVYDYAISAPIMLSVINVLWGANTILGIFVAPAVLSMLLILSYVLITSKGMKRDTAMFWFFCLIVGYVACLIPTMLATADAIQSTGKAADEGTAPPFVAVFVTVFLIVFSTFIYPYYIELTSISDVTGKAELDCFIEFSVLSLIAKITLHAFLGVGVLQQTAMTSNVNEIVARGDPPDTVSPSLAFAIAGGAIAAGLALALYFTHLCSDLFKGPLSKDLFDIGVSSSKSIASRAAFLSVVSVASVGSFASVASVGSIMSVSSVASIGSVHSVGCIGGFFQDCTNDDDAGSFVHLPMAGAITILYVLSIVKLSRMLDSAQERNLAWMAVGSLFVLTILLVAVMYNSSMLCDAGILFVLSGIVLFDESMHSVLLTTATALAITTGYIFIAVAAFVSNETHASTQTLAILCTTLVLACFAVGGVSAGGSQKEKFSAETTRAASKFDVLPLVLVYLLMLAAVFTTAMAGYSVPAIGAYSIGTQNNTVLYGAGPNKRYILFDFSQSICKDNAKTCAAQEEPLQSWGKLHREDKYNVKVTLSGNDTVENTSWIVGVEQKGKDRDVPHLSMEFRDADNFDDAETRVFTKAFADPYSDWWLTFGSPGDTTHARQMFANTANSVPDAVVDVLTQDKSGTVTYEGVALMMPAFKKDLYNNFAHDSSRYDHNPYGKSTKFKCGTEANPELKKAEGSFLQDYNDGNTIKSEFAKTILNRGFMNESVWKMIYPKASLIADTKECGVNGSATLKGYQDLMQKMLHTQSFENVDEHMFVRSYLWEIVLQDTDFPFRSSKYAYNVDDKVLMPGFLWDFNSPSYRALSPTSPFQLRNIYPTFAWTDPLPFWQHVCKKQAHLFEKHKETVKATINEMTSVLSHMHRKYSSKEYTATFARSQRRNNDYGTFVGSILDLVLGTVRDMTTKDTYNKELAYQIDRLQQRTSYVMANTDASCTTTDVHYVDYVLALVSFIIILFFVAATALLLTLCCVPADGYSTLASFNTYEMHDMSLW